MSMPLAPAVDAHTILIVDDTPANLAVVVESLEERGVRVVVAQGGAEGLQRADLVRPDLILLDVMMPGLDGFEICRRLKACAGTQDIPVIFMTSLRETEDKVTGFKAGAVDYLTKPLRIDEVMARVDTHLNLHVMHKQLEAQNAQLQKYREGLEHQVAERTAELRESNQRLHEEVLERERAEQEIRRLNTELEARVVERTAQLTASNRELEAFSYSVSHDLRAPLRAISGFSAILARRHRESLDEEGRHYLDNVVVAGRRMEHLIEDLLHYSRTGRVAVLAVPVPLAPLVQQIAATFGARIAAAGVHYEVAEPLATPLGDPTLLGQILANLVDNALTYRRRDSTPEVKVSALGEGEQVVLRVADNGIGIAPEYHEKIFQMFQRLHEEDEYPGTGIGLAIVAKSARLMEGEVGIVSVPGEGSTFSVRLPAATIEPSEERSAA